MTLHLSGTVYGKGDPSEKGTETKNKDVASIWFMSVYHGWTLVNEMSAMPLNLYACE